MSTPLTLMAVHAHPDDESSSTGGILARYSDEGVQTVVVTCTNGELGDAPGGIKPGEEGHDEAEVARIRLGELERACETLGVAHLEMLGYHDSGMVDWEHKDRPDVFCNVAVDDAAERLSDLFEQYQPDVVVTYDELGGYDHPDHVHASRVAMAAVARTGIPRKAYFTAFRRSTFAKFRAVLEEQGADLSQFPQPDPERLRMMDAVEARITTASTSVGLWNESAPRSRRTPARSRSRSGPACPPRRSACSLVRRPSSERRTPPARRSRRRTSSSGCARTHGPHIEVCGPLQKKYVYILVSVNRVESEDFAGCLAGNLRAASRLATRRYDAELRESGLRITQVAILAQVRRHDVLSISELASRALERTLRHRPRRCCLGTRRTAQRRNRPAGSPRPQRRAHQGGSSSAPLGGPRVATCATADARGPGQHSRTTYSESPVPSSPHSKTRDRTR